MGATDALIMGNRFPLRVGRCLELVDGLGMPGWSLADVLPTTSVPGNDAPIQARWSMEHGELLETGAIRAGNLQTERHVPSARALAFSLIGRLPLSTSRSWPHS